MNETQHQELCKQIEALRRKVADFSTEELAMRVVTSAGPLRDYNDHSLKSPLKQSYYLLRLMLSTPEPRHPAVMNDKEWQECIELLETIFGAYGLMFFPHDGDFADFSQERVHATEVAMPAFLHHYNTTGNFASAEQIAERTRALFDLFAENLREYIGIDAATALEIINWSAREMQREADTLTEALGLVKEMHRETLPLIRDYGWSSDQVRQVVQADPRSTKAWHGLKASKNPFRVRQWALQKQFGKDLAERFWNRFVSRRGEAAARGEHPTFTYPTDRNPAELKPLFLYTKNVASCPNISVLYEAVGKQMTLVLTRTKDSPLAKAFYKHRDGYLERKMEETFRSFFGSDALYHPAVFDQPASHGEHDLVIVWNRFLFIIEAKAAGPVEPFRDPEKAFVRIKRQFDSESGISKAYDQTQRLRALVEAKRVVELFDQRGNPVTQIAASEIDYIFCIVVTLDNFGALAADLSLLLEKQPDAAFPWAVSLYDLEAFLDGLRYRGWGPEKLCEYLNGRALLHGRVHTTDELEIGGLFLTEGTLDTLLNAEGERLFLDPSLSDVFDAIWTEKQGGPKANLMPKAGPIILAFSRSSETEELKL